MQRAIDVALMLESCLIQSVGLQKQTPNEQTRSASVFKRQKPKVDQNVKLEIDQYVTPVQTKRGSSSDPSNEYTKHWSPRETWGASVSGCPLSGRKQHSKQHKTVIMDLNPRPTVFFLMTILFCFSKLPRPCWSCLRALLQRWFALNLSNSCTKHLSLAIIWMLVWPTLSVMVQLDSPRDPCGKHYFGRLPGVSRHLASHSFSPTLTRAVRDALDGVWLSLAFIAFTVFLVEW